MERAKGRLKPLTILSFHPLFRLASSIVRGCIQTLAWALLPLLYGFRVKGRRHLRGLGKGGLITVSNHCLVMDPVFVGVALTGHRCQISGTEKSFRVKGLNALVRLAGGFPIPFDRPGCITPYVLKALQKNDWVHFFAEGDVFDYNQTVRPLKPGAFFYAFRSGVPMLPIALILKRRGFGSRRREKPRVRVCVRIGAPFYPFETEPGSKAEPGMGVVPVPSVKAQLQAAALRMQSRIQSMIDAEGGDRSLYSGQLTHFI